MISHPAAQNTIMDMNHRCNINETDRVLALSELTEYSVDPESMDAGISNYPLYKTFTFGVSCKF